MAVTCVLARVILFAPDVPAAAAFYHKVLGLPIVGDPQDREFIELDAGGCRVAFHRGAAQSVAGRSSKLVFRVEDVEAAKTSLNALGAGLGSIMRGPEFSFCDGRDPAGNVFQISSRS